MLQRQSGFPLQVHLVHSLQALAESAGEHRQQGLVLGSEPPPFDQLHPDDEHAAGMLQCDSRRPELVGVDGEQVAIAKNADCFANARRQLRPPHGLTGTHQVRWGRPPHSGRKCAAPER